MEKKKKNISGIIFEGDYLNGKKWNVKGYISKHTNANEKSFLYEIKDGKGYFKEVIQMPIGFGWITVFEGNYLNGEKNGKGKEYYDNVN